MVLFEYRHTARYIIEGLYLQLTCLWGKHEPILLLRMTPLMSVTFSLLKNRIWQNFIPITVIS
jgi:hypothetical protein